MLALEETYVLNEDIVLRSIHDKFWCLDTKKGTQYRLNRVSYDILSHLMSGVILSDVLEEVASKYDVTMSAFTSDAVSLLNLALNKNIIRKEGGCREA